MINIYVLRKHAFLDNSDVEATQRGLMEHITAI